MIGTEGRRRILGAIDKVKPSLRPHKKVSHRVETQPAAEATHEMANAGVICAPAKVGASDLPRIEARAHRANASHGFDTNKLVKARSVDRVEIPEQRPVGQDPGVKGLAGSPRYLALYSKVFVYKSIAADGQESAASQALFELSKNSGRGARGRRNSASTNGKINLLTASRRCN